MKKTRLDINITYILIFVFCIIANLIAFFFQLKYNELPCPLCLLQRFGFIAVAFGAMLNILRGNSWKHDLIILLSSLYTFFVGVRQIMLHILPHDLGYGSSFLGLHFYTWSVISSFLFILALSLTHLTKLIVDSFFKDLHINFFLLKLIRPILIVIVLLNLISTYLECGFTQCPDNPTRYIELQKHKFITNPVYTQKI
jgi:disulfide bond formation protein DsbB